MRRLIGSVLVSLTTTAIAAALLAPPASASPIGDAEAAIMAAWDKAGGDTSPLGARKGDVYPVGDGFALDFDGGKMFFTPATGAKFAYGPILDKYESLGGPAGSDLGFPSINEVPGLAGPDSRVITFAASDKPVIYWTPDHGAYVVRGAINAAWDKLGSSGGVLGVPVGDETYSGTVSSQKFSGGQVSWDRQTKQFTTDPPALADQLKGLQVAIDPTAEINTAWRAAGGPNGPLGARQGGQYPIGGDGLAQNFVGGKVFFSPATGANAIENDILAKYESLGGPGGSDLGFPTANETDGGVGPSSHIATFSAKDKPVIFWTPDHGAFVVRGAMKAAWDKLRGPAGKLGAPVADQAVDGDVISQQFAGGKISWNRAKNTFNTDPSNLAPLLSGLQVSGQNQPSGSAMPSHGKKFAWQWWWALAVIPVLVLLGLLVWLVFGRRRRGAGQQIASPIYQPDRDVDAGYDPTMGRRWASDDAEGATEHFGLDDSHQPEHEPPPDPGLASRVSWRRQDATDEPFAGEFAGEQEDPDAVDTDSFPVVTDEMLSEAGYLDVEEAEYDDAGVAEAEYAAPAVAEDDYIEADVAETEYAEEVPETVGPDEADEAAYPIAGHVDADYEEVGTPESAAPNVRPSEAVIAGGAAAGGAAAAMGSRAGRHAAADEEDASDDGQPTGPVAGPAGRPTIHLPLEDPYQMPEGYPIKASARFGLYYTPGSDLYHDTLAEIWLASEEVAQANGFVKAD
ncbi:MAG: LGFP repeat-containing protein [Mycobacterium sp.]|uniref:LGFP repeat-containing protein n=1 Tax=Mycobacterium sp. TaxID=1785 RepID=UPI001EC40B03|nr:hypothetical protein [Mycobacterium sp.]MBV8789104.1 LGFP repeat-containing protein [Mycobacterium sp.]